MGTTVFLLGAMWLLTCFTLGEAQVSYTGGGVLFNDVTNYNIVQFKSSGTFTLSSATTARVLVVGGGGGGGINIGGGGGAAAGIYMQDVPMTAGTYTVSVGAGGVAGTHTTVTTGATNGGDSSIYYGGNPMFLAKGGGFGGYAQETTNAGSGGCGGSSAGFAALDNSWGVTVNTNVVNFIPGKGPGANVFGTPGCRGATVTTAGVMNSYFWPMANDATRYRFIYPIGDWFVGEGKSRYRPAYNVTLKGWMGLCDIGYEFEKIPFKICAAMGLISGDNYPYNEEVNKTYRGFLPLRDINYQGHLVKSVAIFTYRLMPRPLNIATGDILARSNIDDSSNIRFFGFGVDYAPLKDKKQLSLNANLAFFWEDADLYIWDKNGSIPVPEVPAGDASIQTWNTYAVARAKEDSRQAYTGDSSSLNSTCGLDLEGWQGTILASKRLGTEINFQATYRLTKKSDMIFRGGYFFPGQLYKDLDGQPNILTRTWIQNDQEVRRSLGSNYCYAWNLRFQYIF
ncbi:MAG: glycine-rich domain-containing protein [Paludibacter sp.]